MKQIAWYSPEWGNYVGLSVLDYILQKKYNVRIQSSDSLASAIESVDPKVNLLVADHPKLSELLEIRDTLEKILFLNVL